MDTTTTGRPVRRGSRTAALAGLGLLAGVAAKAADASGVGWLADVGSYPAAWVALSLTAVPAFAAVVHDACTRRGLLPGALLAGAASLALADRTLWHLVVRPEGAALHPVQGVVAAVVAMVVAGVLPG